MKQLEIHKCNYYITCNCAKKLSKLENRMTGNILLINIIVILKALKMIFSSQKSVSFINFYNLSVLHQKKYLNVVKFYIFIWTCSTFKENVSELITFDLGLRI